MITIAVSFPHGLHSPPNPLLTHAPAPDMERHSLYFDINNQLGVPLAAQVRLLLLLLLLLLMLCCCRSVSRSLQCCAPTPASPSWTPSRARGWCRSSGPRRASLR